MKFFKKTMENVKNNILNIKIKRFRFQSEFKRIKKTELEMRNTNI